MQRIRKVGTTLRNNWKKSIFFSVAGAYGVKWYSKKLADEDYMRGLAREALSYGSTLQGVQAPSYAVTVILNPVASGGKGRKLYEQYCAPLLHLAGFKVSVVRTESEGQAKDIMEIMKDADAVLVAGGDGLLLEAVTGLLRRDDKDQVAPRLPLGVLPVGRTNTMANRLVEGAEGDQTRLMGEATMNVVRQLRKPVGVLELENQTEERRGQKVYGLNSVRLGAWVDAQRRKGKYWLTGGLKDYLTYVGSYLTGHKEVLWDCDLKLQYSKVDTKWGEEEGGGSGGWFNWFAGKDLKQKTEVERGVEEVKWVSRPTRFNGSQVDIEPGEEQGLVVRLNKGGLGLGEYVRHGISITRMGASIVRGAREGLVEHETIHTDSLIMEPEKEKEREEEEEGKVEDEGKQKKEGPKKSLILDGEAIELDGPVKVTYLKDKILMFCSGQPGPATPAEKSSAEGRWSSVSGMMGRKLQ